MDAPIQDGQTPRESSAAGLGENSRPFPGVFRGHPLSTWGVVGFLCLYLVVAWVLFFRAVEPGNYFSYPVRVAADSDAYWELAGFVDVTMPRLDNGPIQLSSTMGPVIVAKIFRDKFVVGLLDCTLLLLAIWSAGKVPGVDRRVFTMLLLIDGMTMPSLITLNKEIFAVVGMVFAAQWIYSRSRPLWLLSAAALLSMLARWEQIAILMLFIGLESRFSPFRGRHRAGLAAVIGAITVAYPLALRRMGASLGPFLAQAEAGHTIALLNRLQAHFGFPLAVLPKILMNVGGYVLTPSYFFGAYWYGYFQDLQIQFFSIGHMFAFSALMAVAFIEGRLTVERPLPYLMWLYLVVTVVNPFVQTRYEYPAYGLLCVEMARQTWALEPVRKRLLGRIRRRLSSPLALPQAAPQAGR
jgi:hypothetical protein